MIDIQRIRSNIQQHYKNKKEEYYKQKAERNRERYSKYYQDPRWKNLRSWYRSVHPICECHEKYNIIVPATCVHHLKPWSKGITEEAKWNLLLSPNNLKACCDSCHKEFHKQLKLRNLDYLDEIVPVDIQLKNT